MQDIAFYETKTHGSEAFPYIVYKGDIPRYINSFPLHWHEETEIVFVEGGSGTVTVQSERYAVGHGDIVVIPPQTVHAIDCPKSCTMQYYNIVFSLSMLDNVDDICRKKYFEPIYRGENSIDNYIVNGSALNALIAPHILRLIDNRHELAHGGELMIKSELFAVLHYLSTNAKPAERIDSAAGNYEKLKKLLAYVREHYGENISVKAAADICAYSSSHFMKMFKNMTGQSFTEYLIDYRLGMAANALALSSRRIIDIAYNCGFENLSYFSRAFASKFGVTPTEYRKRSAETSHSRD